MYIYNIPRHARISPQVSASMTEEKVSLSAAVGQTGGGSSLEIQKEMPRWQGRVAVTEQSCVPYAFVSVYTCVYLYALPVSLLVLQKILTALAHILEERGHILQYQWHDWARQAVSGCYIPTAIFNSLMWKKCRSRQTDSSTHEPSIYASVPQYCVLSHHQCLSWEDLWT